MQLRLSQRVAWRNSKLMTFDTSNAHVRTHFSEELVVLVREVSEMPGRGLQGLHTRLHVLRSKELRQARVQDHVALNSLQPDNIRMIAPRGAC